MDDAQTTTEQIAPAAQEEKNTAIANPPVSFNWMDKASLNTAFTIAKGIASSELVPAQYKNNPWSVMIAMDMANRTGFAPLHVMQNLYVIQGKPSWSGQFCIAVVNGSGRFSPLEFIQLLDGDGKIDGYFCRATRLADGKICEGSPVTWKMVKGESWDSKSGSKWKTMPDLMFHYRAAAFFVREHCPDLLCGLQTSDEVQDVKGYVKEQDTVRISL